MTPPPRTDFPPPWTRLKKTQAAATWVKDNHKEANVPNNVLFRVGAAMWMCVYVGGERLWWVPRASTGRWARLLPPYVHSQTALWALQALNCRRLQRAGTDHPGGAHRKGAVRSFPLLLFVYCYPSETAKASIKTPPRPESSGLTPLHLPINHLSVHEM